MSNNAMESKVRELVELKKIAAELADEITAIEDEIKAVMGDEEELTAGAFKVFWTKVTSQRFDTSLFKATPHKSAARQAIPFPPSAACKSFDLLPVSLQDLRLHLTKNSFA